VPAGFSGDSMYSNSLFAELLKILGFMGLLLVGCLLLVRKYGETRFAGKSGKTLEIVESLGLGGPRLVCLVRAGRNHFLLGVTDQSVNLIKELGPSGDTGDSAPLEVSEAPAHAMEDIPAEGPRFSTMLADEVKKIGKRLSGKRFTLGLMALLVLGAAFVCPAPCHGAPAALPIPDIDISIDGQTPGGGLGTSLGILGLLTVLSLAPAIVMLTTSFTRMVIVFSFLRSGLGTQQTPPNQVLIGLALILTFFVMTPTWSQVYAVSLEPYIAGEITGQEAFDLASGPMKEFMLRETRDKDLALFATLGGREAPQTPEEMSLFQVVPAFAISELRTAFEMGFLLYLPFLVIDMVVASTLMSMGMLMLPPVLISLPFKLLLFVLVDGWSLITKSLLGGFA
jgi:flagellar biosynthetic protein FliP